MSQVAASFTSRLVDVIAADRVFTDSASLAAFEVDGRRPSAVLLPDSVSEIADILRFASAERLAVIPPVAEPIWASVCRRANTIWPSIFRQ
jgi:hypothetical protein